MSDRIRVLICDDSAFARKVLREILSRDPSIEIVGTARDGLDALEKIAEAQPDVVTLDLLMPHLDGVGTLEALAESGPRVVVVSSSPEDSALVVQALQAGAITAIQKPTALATDRLYEISAELSNAVKLAAAARAMPAEADPMQASPPLGAGKPRIDLVAIGASTGGPRALSRLLQALPADFPAAIAAVVHMPIGYTEAFAQRLNETCALEVVEAKQDMPLVPGRVVIARAGIHLAVVRDGTRALVGLEVKPLEALHRPAVDVLFTTAAQAFGSRMLGVVLTGMGSDGLAGARAIDAAGARTIVESAASCVVYGMSRSVAEAGLAAEEIALWDMAGAIGRRVTESGPESG